MEHIKGWEGAPRLCPVVSCVSGGCFTLVEDAPLMLLGSSLTGRGGACWAWVCLGSSHASPNAGTGHTRGRHTAPRVCTMPLQLPPAPAPTASHLQASVYF